MTMTREEIIRIRNLGCGDEWPKVWNRQLSELCDIALAEQERNTEPPARTQTPMTAAEISQYGEIRAPFVFDMERRLQEAKAELAGWKKHVLQADQNATDQVERALAAEQALERERETHRMQLAAISTATFANTQVSFAENDLPMEHPYYSVTFNDVKCAIVREMRERERAETLQAELEMVRDEAMEQKLRALSAFEKAAGDVRGNDFYDPKFLQLACHCLFGTTHSPADQVELAQKIQDAVEGYLIALQCRDKV